MAAFSTTQTNQLYVAKSLVSSFTSSTPVGAIDPNVTDNSLTFQYQSVDGVERTDFINLRYDKLHRGLSKNTVVLDSNVNSGAPVVGQNYELRFTFYEWGSASAENQFYKFGAVIPTTGMTASSFYKEMLVNLVDNFKTMAIPVLSFSATDGTHIFTYVGKTWYQDAVATTESAVVGLTGLIIEEIEQPYRLGVKSSDALNFKITSPTVLFSGSDVSWAIITAVTPTTFIGNGKKTADREFFYLGERGDIYRNIGYPNNIAAIYLVDSTLEYNYIDISYYYVGHNEEMQRSEKNITLVVPAVGAAISDKVTLANSIITAINTVTGATTIATLATT